ncbi:sigma-70 family RNA polymerase sigma factor [Paenibacillus sp. WST5]|uniref:Sigma-70 family RNA polymerase sigma factor n=2 Tax=Paenibacillus sedimenti TaxID=2770274 RepID=A0A926KNS6_9BACL|nr:sigma-70 family RNA polymerase sigma factor [Paenibacillus sedimenti]
MDEMARTHMRLVYSVANKFNRSAQKLHVDFDDLVGAGCIGLVAAIKNFDPESFNNVQFSTYAVPMISGEIKRFLNGGGARAIRAKDMIIVLGKIYKQNLFAYSPDEIADILDCKLYLVFDAIKYNKFTYMSKDAIAFGVDEERPIPLELMLSHEQDDTSAHVKEFLSTLTEHELTAVMMRLNDALQREISEVIGIAQSQVSRLLIRIGNRFKEYMAGEAMA